MKASYMTTSALDHSRGADPNPPLARCEGDCDLDSGCSGSLMCFQRTDEGATEAGPEHDSPSVNPPGCTGSPLFGATPYDYCYDGAAQDSVIQTSLVKGNQFNTRSCAHMCTTTTGCTAFTVHTGGDEAGLCELFQDCASQPASNVITGFTFVANSNAKTCTTSTGIGTCYDWDGTQTGSVTAVTSTDCGVGKRPGEAAVASSFLFAATIPSSGTATAFCENTPCSGANDIAACCNDILCSDKDGSGGGAVTDSECQAGESGGPIYLYNAANANSACSGGSAGATTCDVSTVGAVDHSICCISILCTAASGHVSVVITTGSSLYADSLDYTVACAAGYGNASPNPTACTTAGQPYTYTQCTALVCTSPDGSSGNAGNGAYTPSNDATVVITETQLNVVTGFSVSIACAAGYIGSPSAVACTANGAYTYTSCSLPAPPAPPPPPFVWPPPPPPPLAWWQNDGSNTGGANAGNGNTGGGVGGGIADGIDDGTGGSSNGGNGNDSSNGDNDGGGSNGGNTGGGGVTGDGDGDGAVGNDGVGGGIADGTDAPATNAPAAINPQEILVLATTAPPPATPMPAGQGVVGETQFTPTIDVLVVSTTTEAQINALSAAARADLVAEFIALAVLWSNGELTAADFVGAVFCFENCSQDNARADSKRVGQMVVTFVLKKGTPAVNVVVGSDAITTNAIAVQGTDVQFDGLDGMTILAVDQVSLPAESGAVAGGNAGAGGGKGSANPKGAKAAKGKKGSKEAKGKDIKKGSAGAPPQSAKFLGVTLSKEEASSGPKVGYKILGIVGGIATITAAFIAHAAKGRIFKDSAINRDEQTGLMVDGSTGVCVEKSVANLHHNTKHTNTPTRLLL